MYSVHAVSRTNLVLFDSLGDKVIGTKATFPRNASGSSLSATRLSARMVEDKMKLDEVCSIDQVKQLDHPIPVETRSEMCLTTVSVSQSKS